MQLSRLVRESLLATSAVFVTLIATPRSAFSQQRRGDIHGTIAGTGGPVIGARVAIERPPRLAVADDRGAYTLRGVPVGGYELVVTALGYKPARR